MTQLIIFLSYSSHITCKHMHSPCPSSSLLPRPLLPLTSPPLPLPLTHTHPLTTEAVVLFDYTKEEDNELSLEMGNVITDVKQVCEPHTIYSSKVPYTEQHNGHSKIAIKMLRVSKNKLIVNRNRALCCFVYSNTLAVSWNWL